MNRQANNLILVYDAETTGLPVWDAPSGGDNQPHIVQLAARLVDADSRAIVQTIDVIVQPDGWEIPDEVVEIHGITTNYAAEVGVPESTALELFMALWTACDCRIAHNERFDARIMRIAAKRYRGDAFADAWKAGTAECTGLLAKPIMQLPPKNRYGYKMPKLVEAHEHFVGSPHEGSHTALGDVDACMAVYFAIKDAEEVEPA